MFVKCVDLFIYACILLQKEASLLKCSASVSRPLMTSLNHL